MRSAEEKASCDGEGGTTAAAAEGEEALASGHRSAAGTAAPGPLRQRVFAVAGD